MKKIIIIVLLCLVVALVALGIVFLKMANNAEVDDTTSYDEASYDVTEVVESLKFLKFNTYEEIKAYAEDYPVYIQTSDDDTVFGIGELYIEGNPVELFYTMNEDGSLYRFDGYYSIEIDKSVLNDVWNKISYTDSVLLELFNVQHFNHSIYDEQGLSIDGYTDESFTKLLEGNAKYSVSVIDEDNTYWYISAVVTDKKQIDFKFFRCFDPNAYADDNLNIDLRIEVESEVE